MNKYIPYVFAKNVQLLQCPICRNPFMIANSQLKCTNHHAFDFAKTGYVNYHNKAVKTLYDKKLFKARSAIIENGYFDSLEQSIVKLLLDELERKGQLTILDAGCGDGSLFSNILLSLRLGT